jgi:hypothetical protein
VATTASRELDPGQSDSGYLWNDDQHDSWVRECQEVERALIMAVLDEMTTPVEAAHVEGLFMPDCQTEMLPPRSGYWLGDLLAQRWLSQYSLRDVLRWNHAEATNRASSELRMRKAREQVKNLPRPSATTTYDTPKDVSSRSTSRTSDSACRTCGYVVWPAVTTARWFALSCRF